MAFTEELSNNKRVRDDSDESELDSPEVKRLRDDLLGCLDDSDLGSASPDLDSFMKSFEDEITASPTPAKVADLTSDSGESKPDLGYLLEASDDELGLPPSTTSSTGLEVADLERVSSELAGLSESWFDDQISSYDSYEFGMGVTESFNNDGEYVPFDTLFDHSDLGDYSDIWFPAAQ